MLCLIRNTNSDNEESLVFNLPFSYLVGCGFCVFETGSLHNSGWPRSLCVNQAGLEIDIFLPLLPVPPYPTECGYKYPLFPGGERDPLSCYFALSVLFF